MTFDPRTRQIYEKAIEVLTDNEAKEMCLRYLAHFDFMIQYVTRIS